LVSLYSKKGFIEVEKKIILSLIFFYDKIIWIVVSSDNIELACVTICGFGLPASLLA
jgi:hypothetical protein